MDGESGSMKAYLNWKRLHAYKQKSAEILFLRFFNTYNSL